MPLLRRTEEERRSRVSFVRRPFVRSSPVARRHKSQVKLKRRVRSGKKERCEILLILRILQTRHGRSGRRPRPPASAFLRGNGSGLSFGLPLLCSLLFLLAQPCCGKLTPLFSVLCEPECRSSDTFSFYGPSFKLLGGEKYCQSILLRTFKPEPGRSVKQEQQKISCDQVQRLFLRPVSDGGVTGQLFRQRA